MRFKHITKLGTAIILAVLVFSCGKESQSTTQGGGTFIVRAKISPPLQSGKTIQSQVSVYNGISLWGLGFSTTWDGSAQTQGISEIISNEISVTSGQNVMAYIRISNLYDFTCRTITLEGIQNGKIIKSYTLNMGYNGSPSAFCTGQLSQNRNFIME
jgi:hypothetical protein